MNSPLKTNNLKVTSYYGDRTYTYQGNRISDFHHGIDLVGGNEVVAFMDGVVTSLVNVGEQYGRMCYVNLKHDNGYYTKYFHLKSGSILVNVGDRVSKGDILGIIGNTGQSTGIHLHFQIDKGSNDSSINPYDYIFNDKKLGDDNNNNKYNVGDIVNINGVYVSSSSTEKLVPLITRGKITRIVNGRNPYLLDNGNIGWVNDDCIIDNVYLSNYTYKGDSIVDALNLINVDSSFNYRKKLAIKNGINDYYGSSEQNIKLLNLLKNGKLIKV